MAPSPPSLSSPRPYSLRPSNRGPWRALSASTWTGSDRYGAGFGAFVAKLKARSELHLLVKRFPDTRVTDWISLRGSNRAINALGCP